jgi:hypothetical protein
MPLLEISSSGPGGFLLEGRTLEGSTFLLLGLELSPSVRFRSRDMTEHVDRDEPDVEEVEELRSRQPGEIDSMCGPPRRKSSGGRGGVCDSSGSRSSNRHHA